MFVFMISVIVLMLGFVFVICEGENHKSEICVRFVILKGKIINMKVVFTFVYGILGQEIINLRFVRL